MTYYVVVRLSRIPSFEVVYWHKERHIAEYWAENREATSAFGYSFKVIPIEI